MRRSNMGPVKAKTVATCDAPVARARAARIMAERELMFAIQRAEASYEATVRLGIEFDRRLARSESFLRDTGHLARDREDRIAVPLEPAVDGPTRRARRTGRVPVAHGLAG
jgi:hypothetical protein